MPFGRLRRINPKMMIRVGALNQIKTSELKEPGDHVQVATNYDDTIRSTTGTLTRSVNGAGR